MGAGVKVYLHSLELGKSKDHHRERGQPLEIWIRFERLSLERENPAHSRLTEERVVPKPGLTVLALLRLLEESGLSLGKDQKRHPQNRVPHINVCPNGERVH